MWSTVWATALGYGSASCSPSLSGAHTSQSPIGPTEHSHRAPPACTLEQRTELLRAPVWEVEGCCAPWSYHRWSLFTRSSCACIPCFCPACKDAVHKCPKCNAVLGMHCFCFCLTLRFPLISTTPRGNGNVRMFVCVCSLFAGGHTTGMFTGWASAQLELSSRAL